PCRGRVAACDPARGYRSHPERRLAGVAAAIGHAVAVPIVAVRVAFIVFTVVTHLGPIVYGALWLLIPYAPGEPPRRAVCPRAPPRGGGRGPGDPQNPTPPPPPRRNGPDPDARRFGTL